MSFTVIPVSENLPRFVAARVAAIGGGDFSRLVVVFPTARLGQHFRRELVERVGACLPPRVTTLSGLIDLLLPPPASRRISGLERSLILRFLLKNGDWKRLGPGMEPLIVDFYRELAQAGHRLDESAVYNPLEAAFRDNPLGSEDYAVYWSQCVRELKKLA